MSSVRYRSLVNVEFTLIYSTHHSSECTHEERFRPADASVVGICVDSEVDFVTIVISLPTLGRNLLAACHSLICDHLALLSLVKIQCRNLVETIPRPFDAKDSESVEKRSLKKRNGGQYLQKSITIELLLVFSLHCLLEDVPKKSRATRLSRDFALSACLDSLTGLIKRAVLVYGKTVLASSTEHQVTGFNNF